MVQDVIKLCAELQVDPFRDLKIAVKSGVHQEEPRAAQRIDSSRAHRSLRWKRECRCIEPSGELFTTRATTRDDWVANAKTAFS
jgi:hypothetical protein